MPGEGRADSPPTASRSGGSLYAGIRISGARRSTERRRSPQPTDLRWPSVTGEVNVDFADVRTVMSNRGAALMGTGEATGENRAVEAAQQAICSPLLDNVSIHGATGILVNISGGMDLAIDEVTTINSIVQEAAGDVDITQADVLVSVGRGIADPENMDVAEALAEEDEWFAWDAFRRFLASASGIRPAGRPV